MRINKRFLLKSAVYALLYIICLVLETNIFARLRVFGCQPNLIVILVVACAVHESERYSAVFGLIAGILTDSAAGAPYFFSGIIYMLTGYVIGYLTRTSFTKSLASMAMLTLPAVALREIVNLFYLIAVWSEFEILPALYKYILPETVYTVVFAVPIYFGVKYTAGRINN
ncbi:hypothetical protein FACS1894105_06630 [Clostridia bacterium]|nr:hypothetical protein FACS1894105_06630 [Clostridia bacterium]